MKIPVYNFLSSSGSKYKNLNNKFLLKNYTNLTFENVKNKIYERSVLRTFSLNPKEKII